jgi:hypothetical protein
MTVTVTVATRLVSGMDGKLKPKRKCKCKKTNLAGWLVGGRDVNPVSYSISFLLIGHRVAQ